MEELCFTISIYIQKNACFSPLVLIDAAQQETGNLLVRVAVVNEVKGTRVCRYRGLPDMLFDSFQRNEALESFLCP